MLQPCKKGWRIFSSKTGKKGFSGLVSKFSSFLRDSNKSSKETSQEVSERIARDTRNNIRSSLQTQTGELESSVYSKKKSIFGTYEVGVNAPYAEYAEFGTGIYNIFGKGRKGGWVYRKESTGEFFYTEGQKPQLFFNKALEKNLGRFSDTLKTKIRRRIR